MALEKKPASLSPEVLAAAKERAAQARKKVEDLGRSNLHTPEEKADAAPFYFVLRSYIRQLKAAREAAGLTLTEVAARSGLALESLSRLETGAQTNPTWRTLGLYAVALGCAPSLTVAPAADCDSAAGGTGAPVAQSSPGPQRFAKVIGQATTARAPVPGPGTSDGHRPAHPADAGSEGGHR